MISRRRFLEALLATPVMHRLSALNGQNLLPRVFRSTAIDRQALVKRHNPRLTALNTLSPLTVGNGEFAFTADVTGLQTLASEYENATPLCTMSQWGWHTRTLPANLKGTNLRLTQYETHGRQVGYQTSSAGQVDLFNWLRENPHRLHLGRVSLCFDKSSVESIEASDIESIDQVLDLWRGVLTSRFKLRGKPVTVTTVVHPDMDLLAVRVESPLISDGGLSVRFDFPYGSPAMQAADWNRARAHNTKLIPIDPGEIHLQRTLDQDSYAVTIRWSDGAIFEQIGKHSFALCASSATNQLECVSAFSLVSNTKPLPTVTSSLAAAEAHWRRFWTEGTAVELIDSRDSRAVELERRIVLSQYLTAVQCAGSLPPQETGLTVNSWYGKFHLEMHWWHATHFALWNRIRLFEKSLGWYESIREQARGLAQSQGYRGARWPKMVGPEGRDSPSPIGPLLIWQQPHPIFYAELCYRAHPNQKTLDRYRQVVFDSAEFMASYAFFDKRKSRYVLGPPVIPAQENHPARETWNPTFELAYWSYGLKVAQSWRERLGMKRDPNWQDVINKLAALPVYGDVYVAHENCPKTFTERNRDHPSMLGALGFLPGDGVDRETMRRTLKKTIKEWNWSETWGWDYPLTAMTAARLGEPELAIDALLMTSEKNRFLPNGHNWQRENLPCYLPGNGGLLYAIALMAGGWRGGPRKHAPGFPAGGSWLVRWENPNPLLV